jgi:hypothetical protein
VNSNQTNTTSNRSCIGDIFPQNGVPPILSSLGIFRELQGHDRSAVIFLLRKVKPAGTTAGFGGRDVLSLRKNCSLLEDSMERE